LNLTRIVEALLGKKRPAEPPATFVPTPPDDIVVEGALPFPLARTLQRYEGFRLADRLGSDRRLGGTTPRSAS
jgi:hypothetical protein